MKFKVVTYSLLIHQEDETTKEIAPRHGKRWVRVLIYFTLQHCVQLGFRKKNILRTYPRVGWSL